jgi:DNA replication protein DnaC
VPGWCGSRIYAVKGWLESEVGGVVADSLLDLPGAPDCPVCHGMGYVRLDVPVGHPHFGKLFPCKCRAEEMRQQQRAALQSLGNLQALDRMTFENFKLDQETATDPYRASLQVAYDGCRTYAEHSRGWLVLLGTYGCGKTHLAAAIANVCLKRGVPVLFVAVPDLLDELRAAYSPDSPESYAERFEQVRDTPVLILDDLGTENGTPWAQEKLFQIFNYRYLNRLPTVITSNHALEEMEPRLRSRLGDVGLVQIYKILVGDYRQGVAHTAGVDLNFLPICSDLIFSAFDLRQGELSREENESLSVAWEVSINYAEHPEGWLIFCGGYGCGKTHLAASIANERVRKGYAALMVVVPDLLDYLRGAFNPKSFVSYDQRFEEIRCAPLLIMDDLGMESATPWAQEKLFQIFNYRYVARLPTVITTSQALGDLNPKLRVRLLDPVHCKVVTLLAPPYRGRIAPPPARKSAKGSKPKSG